MIKKIFGVVYFAVQAIVVFFAFITLVYFLFEGCMTFHTLINYPDEFLLMAAKWLLGSVGFGCTFLLFYAVYLGMEFAEENY